MGQHRSGKVNESVAVVYMEGWRRHGAACMRVLLRMLRLDTNAFLQTDGPTRSASPSVRTLRENMLCSAEGSLLSLLRKSFDRYRNGCQQIWRRPPVRGHAVQQCDRLPRITGMPGRH